MNFEVLILGHLHKMPSKYSPLEYKPPEYKPPKYKPPKKCLRTSISPGLICWILRYLSLKVFLGKNSYQFWLYEGEKVKLSNHGKINQTTLSTL